MSDPPLAHHGDMKIPRFYLDTSVLGGCFDREFEPWSSALINDFKSGHLKPVSSELVEAELAAAPASVQLLYTELLGLDLEVIPLDVEAFELADLYQKREILTPNFYDDGVHIALATLAEVDLLVSWNFKHIVHYDKIRRFNAVNLERGYKPLIIYSPREVARYDEDDR